MIHILNESGPKNIKWVPDGGSIQSVIDSITDASATNPYTVMIPPGIFEEDIVMKNYVSLVGSGMKATEIKVTTPFLFASHVTISNLTVNQPNISVLAAAATNCTAFVAENIDIIGPLGLTVYHTFEGSFYSCKISFFETGCSSAIGTALFFGCDIVGSAWASGPDVFLTSLFGCSVGKLECSPGGEIQAYNCRVNMAATMGGSGIIKMYGGYADIIYNSNGGVFEIYGTVSPNISSGMNAVTGDSQIMGKINVSGIAEYADNTAALAGGLVAGDFYRTGDTSKVVH